MLIYFPVTHSIQIHASCVFSPPRHNHFWLSAHDRYYLFLLFIYLGGLILELSLLWLQVNHGHEYKKIHQLSFDFMYMYLYIYISIGQKTFDIFAQVFDNYSDRWCTNLDLPDSFTTPIFVLVSFLHVHITSRFSWNRASDRESRKKKLQ